MNRPLLYTIIAIIGYPAGVFLSIATEALFPMAAGLTLSFVAFICGLTGPDQGKPDEK